MKVHQIKCIGQFFQPLIELKKLFEYRLNDRNYQVGDSLEISEVFMDNGQHYFTGRKVNTVITYVLSREKLNTIPIDFVVLGIRLVGSSQDEVLADQSNYAPVGADHEVYDFEEN